MFISRHSSAASAERPCAVTVASAAPRMPQANTAMNSQSSRMLHSRLKIMMAIAATVRPLPRSRGFNPLLNICRPPASTTTTV